MANNRKTPLFIIEYTTIVVPDNNIETTDGILAVLEEHRRQLLEKLSLNFGANTDTSHIIIHRPDSAVLISELTKPVQQLEMSVRSHNRLRLAGIRYVYQLVQQTEHDLLRFPKLGPGTLCQIKYALEEIDLRLGMKVGKDFTQEDDARIRSLLGL